MDAKVAQAYRLVKTGEKNKARNLLISVVRTDRTNEDAWLLLGHVIESKQKKIQCFQKVIELNPKNEKAQKALSRLKKTNLARDNSPQTPSNTDNINRKLYSPGPATEVPPLENPPQTTPPLTDQQLMEQYVAKMNAEGWTVVSLTQNSVQLRKPKRWSATLLILGVLLGPLGIGLILIIIAVVDYSSKNDEMKFVTATELRHNYNSEQQHVAFQTSTNSKTSQLNDPFFLILVVMVVLLVVLCLFSGLLT